MEPQNERDSPEVNFATLTQPIFPDAHAVKSSAKQLLNDSSPYAKNRYTCWKTWYFSCGWCSLTRLRVVPYERMSGWS